MKKPSKLTSLLGSLVIGTGVLFSSGACAQEKCRTYEEGVLEITECSNIKGSKDFKEDINPIKYCKSQGGFIGDGVFYHSRKKVVGFISDVKRTMTQKEYHDSFFDFAKRYPFSKGWKYYNIDGTIRDSN